MTSGATQGRVEQLRELLIRNTNTVKRERYLRAPLYDSMCASLTKGTSAQKLGCSIDTVAPGQRSCPYHFHHVQEEMFIVLQGQGTLRVAGEMLPISAGDVITIPCGPEYPHQIINTSDADLEYLSISTQEDPEVCEYPDSGKIGTFSRGKRLMHRMETSLDYWDGEA